MKLFQAIVQRRSNNFIFDSARYTYKEKLHRKDIRVTVKQDQWVTRNRTVVYWLGVLPLWCLAFRGLTTKENNATKL